MHILSTFKKLLATPVSANDKKHCIPNSNYALDKSKLHSYDSQNTTLAFLKSLQMMCGQIPGSEVMVQMKGREVNFHLSWDENSAAPFSDEIMFSLNGRDNNATLYKEATENKATDKTTDQSSAIKENSHEKEQTVKDTSSKDNNKSTGKQTMMQSLQTFLKSHYVFRFNALTTQTEFAKVSQEKADSHRLMFQPLNKRNLNGISCAALNNGIDCWDKDIKRYVESDKVKEYNPFTLYFDNLPSLHNS